MKRSLWFLWALPVFLMSCGGAQSTKGPLSPEEEAAAKVDSLKARAEEGDLVVRLTDDVVSDVIRNMNDSDKAFSHAGIVVIRDNQKMVCNITPDDKDSTKADTIRYEPLDSFANPAYILTVGLFRYELTPAEKQVFLSTLDSFKHLRPRFDEEYNYATDDKMYCSEMIAKALYRASNGRMECKQMVLPENLVKLFKLYYRRYNYPEDRIRATRYVPIDNLYRVPGCTELMRSKLKYVTGDSGN